MKLLDFLLLIDLALILIFTPLAFGAVSNWSQLIFFLLISAGGFIWVLKIILSSRINFIFTPFHIPLLVFFLFFLLHSLFSPLPYFSRREFYLGLSYLVFFLLMINNLNTRKKILFFLVLLIILGVFFSSYALLANYKIPGSVYGLGPRQYDHRSQFILPGLGLGVISRVKPEGYGKRLDAPFICPNHLAGYLEMILPLVLALFFISSRSFKKNFLFAAIALLILAAFLLTLSRGGWLSLLGGLVFFILWAAHKKVISGKFFFLLGIILISGVIGVGIGVKPIRERIIRETLRPRISSQMRVVVWGDTLRMIKARPAFGWGLSTYKWIYPRFRSPRLRAEINYAHNDYLHILAETGVIGLGLFLWLAGAVLVSALTAANQLKPGRSRTIVMGATVSIVIILIHSFFDFNLHIPANALLLCGIISIAIAAGREGQADVIREWKLEFKLKGRPGLKVFSLVCLILAASLVFRSIARELDVDRLSREGEALRKSLNWREAGGIFNKVVIFEPRNPFLWAKLGEVLSSQARWSRREGDKPAREAILAYGKALTINPYWAEIRAKLGRTLQLRGEMKKARKEFQAALTLDPNNSFYHDLLGMYYREVGDLENARREFRKALKITPQDSLARRQLNLVRIK